ncbi:hypothetical protein Q3G72_023414 [Acer saccharum]|nr:hypothetical protein Q3G72_023414 [Acer saccharum]
MRFRGFSRGNGEGIPLLHRRSRTNIFSDGVVGSAPAMKASSMIGDQQHVTEVEDILDGAGDGGGNGEVDANRSSRCRGWLLSLLMEETGLT